MKGRKQGVCRDDARHAEASFILSLQVRGLPRRILAGEGVRMSGRARWVALICAAAASVTACSGPRDAPPAPSGFFPSVFSGVGFVQGAHLLNARAVPATVRTLRFQAVAPAPGGWALVARCDHGRIQVDLGGGTSGGPCHGTAGVIAGCAGGFDKQLTVTVDRRQVGEWGLAIYRSTCAPESAAERRAKESPSARPTSTK